MRIKPEQMLEQQRIAAELRIKDSHAEQSLDSDEHEGNREYRRAQHKDNCSGINRPDEQRQSAPGHTRRPEFVYGYDEVHSGEDRRKSSNENPDQRRHNLSLRKLAAVGGIEGPSGIDAPGQDGV